MSNKFKHLSREDRIYIEKKLNENFSISQIAKDLNKSHSTILREIKKYKSFLKHKPWNNYTLSCANKHICNVKFCNFKQPCYVLPSCSILNKSPYVCNGCNSRRGCRKDRFVYFAKEANDSYIDKLSSSRKGIDITLEEIEVINKIISPLIIHKNQSINHIFINHQDILPFSKTTFYNYVDYRIFEFKNMDLPRKVSYKVRKNSKKRRTKEERKIRLNRTYSDFELFTAKHPNFNIVEMDTVEGIKGGKTLLTLLWRKSNFMLIFLLDSITKASVTSVFLNLQQALGVELYKDLFQVILTDNGSEFFNPLSIECDYLTGEKLISLFYCDPSCSYQKGTLEKNHQFIRKILPKGSSFDHLTQQDCFTMASHINSVCRESLNNKCPFKAQLFITDEKILNKLNIFYIEPDEVTLNKSIFKQ